MEVVSYEILLNIEMLHKAGIKIKRLRAAGGAKAASGFSSKRTYPVCRLSPLKYAVYMVLLKVQKDLSGSTPVDIIIDKLILKYGGTK